MMTLPLSQYALVALAREAMHDRIVGCLFGSAIGDAIGLYTEFLPASMCARAYPARVFILAPVTEVTQFRRDAHRNPHEPGEWTDDTDHAMCILLAYLHKDGKNLDPLEFASRLHTWVRYGLRALDTLPLGLGRTVGSIVRSKEYLEDPEATARRFWVKSKYNAAPNGSLMRTHPLGLMCIDKTIEETFEVAAAFSVVTHVDSRCIISCAIGTALVRGLVRHEVHKEEHIDHMISKALNWYSGYHRRQLEKDPSRKDEPELDVAEFQRHARVSELSELQLDDAIKLGYVYKTFGSGIHLLRLAMRRVAASTDILPTQTTVFEPLIVDLIMCGGDADTNACFAGALLGAYIGHKALPWDWRDGLLRGEWLMKKAEGLSITLGIGDGSYRGSEDKDTAPDGGRGKFPTDAQMEEKVMLLQARMVEREQERDRQEERERQEEMESNKKSRMSWFNRN